VQTNQDWKGRTRTGQNVVTSDSGLSSGWEEGAGRWEEKEAVCDDSWVERRMMNNKQVRHSQEDKRGEGRKREREKRKKGKKCTHLMWRGYRTDYAVTWFAEQETRWRAESRAIQERQKQVEGSRASAGQVKMTAEGLVDKPNRANRTWTRKKERERLVANGRRPIVQKQPNRW
jgi:hypothetical protein